jgi:hypothetical protein
MTGFLVEALANILAAVRTDKLTCLAGRDEDGSEQGTCRSHRRSYSRGEHYEYGLEEGEQYFFLLVTPTDPASFVVVTSATSPRNESRRFKPTMLAGSFGK